MKARDMRGKPATGPDAPNWWLAHLVKNVAGRLLLALYRVRFIGLENLPDGGAVLAGNHVSYLDPCILWCGLPRPTHFMTKVELWDIKWLGWALDKFWAFPVYREGVDRDALQTADRLLKRGEWVGVFPEGTRKRENPDEVGEGQGGAAFIAQRAGVPVVPIGIAGTDKAWPPGKKLPRLVRVTISIGKPCCPERYAGKRHEVVEAMTADIMRGIVDEREKARGA